MAFPGSWRAIPPAAWALILTPLLLKALKWLFTAPPVFVDAALRRKYRRLNVLADGACLFGLFAPLALAAGLHAMSPWVIGMMFGWAVLLPVGLIALATLPRGERRWDEFWLVYEDRYGVHRLFFFITYGLLMTLGLACTAGYAVSFLRR